MFGKNVFFFRIDSLKKKKHFPFVKLFHKCYMSTLFKLFKGSEENHVLRFAYFRQTC